MSSETERRHNEIFWASPNRVGQGIATYADLDQSIFEELETREDVAGDQLAMDSVAASEAAMDVVAASEMAMDAVAASEMAMDVVAASETAMDVVVASETARDAIRNSPTASDAVGASNLAIGKFAVGSAGLNPSDFADMDAVAASATARGAIRNSATALEAVGASNMAIGKFAVGSAGLNPSDFADMDAVAASETAMDVVAASETAMDVVAASETAMDAVVVSETVMDALAASETAYAAILGVDFPKTVENSELTHETDRIRYTRQSGRDGEAGVALTQSLSFDNKSSLKIKVRADTLGDFGARMEASVKIGGSTVLNLDGENTDFVVRDIDVSDITGRETLELGFESSGLGEDDPYPVDYGLFWLE